ncbi:hypothetical protein B566_EDAN017274 [Ephemera danica]|nr:hypothetical protein B566_EDAN017274 [Ephemera danica]
MEKEPNALGAAAQTEADQDHDSRDDVTPILEQERHGERRSDDGNLAATDLCEDVQSVQTEFRSRAAVLEQNPRSPPAFNLSPGKTQAPSVPSHSFSGPSLHPPAYSQPPPAYSHPPYSHAHIPLCYPYLQGNSHPYHHPYPHPQQVHPPQQPQAGHLPQQHNHEHAQVVYQFLGTVQNPVFIGHQTSINGNVAHEERVQAVYKILLETNKGMSDFALLNLIKHVIDLLVNIMPNFRQIRCCVSGVTCSYPKHSCLGTSAFRLATYFLGIDRI